MRCKPLRQVLSGILLSFFLLSLNANAGMATFSTREDVHSFIVYMADNYGFNKTYLANLFNQVEVKPGIIRMLSVRPRKGLKPNPWFRYRTIFLTEKRAQSGVIFWNTHEKALNLAEKKYGVPPNIITAIVGVETQYGSFLGQYRVIDALSTLAFSGNPRAKYFRHELEEYLLLSREQHFNPLAIRGSYAGAIGMAQFMPSNYRLLGVSYDGNTKPNLINNPNDVVISVANYFKSHGWQSGRPVAVPAEVSGDKYTKLLNSKYKPIFTIAQLESHGVKPERYLALHDRAILCRLEIDPNNYHYWLGLNNFYVITKYNPSMNYAMAVYELSRMIEQRREAEKKQKLVYHSHKS